MVSYSLLRYILKFITLWILISFSLLWILFYRFTWGKFLIDEIMKQTGLDSDLQSIKNAFIIAKNWIKGVLKVILSRSPRSKYPFGYAILKKNGMYITT